MPALLCSADGGIVLANSAFLHLSGYSGPELRARKGLNTLLKDRPGAKSLLRPFRLPEHRECQLVDRNGAVGRVFLSASAVSGTRLALVTLVPRPRQDRKNSEGSECWPLFAQESGFKTLAEQAQVGVYLVQDGLFHYVNPAFARIHGYRTEELLEKARPEDMIHPNDLSKVSQGILRKLNGEIESLLAEYRAIRKDGQVVVIEAHGSRVIYRGRPAVIGTMIDITERKEAEKAVKESEERFRQLFEQNEEALVIFQSGTLRILDANPATVSLYGYDKASLTNHGPSLFFPSAGLARFEKILGEIGVHQSFTMDKVETRTRDGKKVCVDIKGKAIKLSDTDVVYCTFHDITEKTRLEEEASLLHSKLIHANKMASLGVLVSSVAHEVNNPNNYILFNASLLTDAWRDSLAILSRYRLENGEFSIGGLPYSEMETVVSKLLLGITEGARRIKGIVDNLKDFARQDKMSFEGEVDMNRVVSGATTLLAGEIKRHTGFFSLDLARGLPPIRGNFQQLEQVVINLVVNALQALPSKKRAIKVSTLSDPDGRHITVQVTDEGVGMSAETMRKIREPFYTTKLATGGTGLGLSISYSIINDHHGSMEFRSEPGKGTTVVVKLPIPEISMEALS